MKKTKSYITVGLTLFALVMTSCSNTETVRERIERNSSEAEITASDENSVLKLQKEVAELKAQVAQLKEEKEIFDIENKFEEPSDKLEKADQKASRTTQKTTATTTAKVATAKSARKNNTSVKVSSEVKSTTSEEPQGDDGDLIYDDADELPVFPCGQEALLKYLHDNIHYPTVAAENGVQGRVIVGFVIEKDGSISNVYVRKGQDTALDKEAMRVVMAMPKWKPAKRNGVNVRMKYNVPVTFRLT